MRARHPVAVLLALGLLLASCGGDGEGDDAGAGAAKLQERSTSGTGYTLVLAPGWTDATRETRESAVRFDLLIVKKGGTFTTNVNVLREKLPDGAGLEDLRKLYRGQLDSIGATNISGTRPATVDDEEAFAHEYDHKTPTGERIHGQQVAVVHDGYAHTITLSASATRFDAADQDFSEMLRSWRWR